MYTNKYMVKFGTLPNHMRSMDCGSINPQRIADCCIPLNWCQRHGDLHQVYSLLKMRTFYFKKSKLTLVSVKYEFILKFY